MQKSRIVLGERNHKKLLSKRIAVVGVGGTGCSVSMLLARMGISLTLIDRDLIEESNIERQILFSKKDIGKPKVLVAKEKLKEFCKVKTFFEDLNPNTVDNLKGSDLVIDCTDNFETRMIINDYCKKNNIAWIFSGASERKVICKLITSKGACFGCFSEDKQGVSCERVGVLNQTVSMAASIAVNLAVNYLAEGKVEEDILRYDLESNSFLKLKVKKNPKCKCCKGKYDYLENKKTKKFTQLCGKSAYSLSTGKKINIKEFSKTIKGEKKVNEFFVKTKEFLIQANGRVIINAKDLSKAKKIFDEKINL
jgi:molybdopterin/thiamine biosynthesis adenylyltransferase